MTVEAHDLPHGGSAGRTPLSVAVHVQPDIRPGRLLIDLVRRAPGAVLERRADTLRGVGTHRKKQRNIP
jgi:hypothetical protein